MTIYVLMSSGKMITLDVVPSDKIKNVKRNIYGKEQIHSDQQHLTFDRKEMENGRTLKGYKIEKNRPFCFILRSLGESSGMIINT